MILYHGSNTPIEYIDLARCRPFKDFGKGFYLTPFEEQASRMAERTVRIFKGNPTVTKFEFNLNEALRSGLNVKIFEKPTTEWARFVMKNRDLNISQPCHDYDLVIGPVADDTISKLLRLFVGNYISEQQLTQELTFSKVTSQYFFHTPKAVSLLKRL